MQIPCEHEVLKTGDLGSPQIRFIPDCMKHAAAFALVVALAPAAAASAETGWSEIMPGARLRALSAGTEAEGRALVGIEIELGAGINTYWRLPGETGLPTTVAASGGDGPVDLEMRWPLPEWDLSEGYVDLVYRDTIILPALVDAPAAAPLTLEIVMGVCSDICVPFRATLSLPGDARTDPGNSLRLRQALNLTPIPFEGVDPPLGEMEFDRTTGALSMLFDPQRIDPMQVFPSLDGTASMFGAPEVDEARNRLQFALLAPGGDTSWQAAALRLTFATDDGPYEIVRKLESR